MQSLSKQVFTEWRTAFAKVVRLLFLPLDSVTRARKLYLPAWTSLHNDLVHSFLYQMDHLGEESYTPSPILEKALDVLFLLHADHELNASCTTVLQTGSSLVDPYSAIAYVHARIYLS